MKTLANYFLGEATLWVPKAAGVVVIVVVFYILSRIAKRVISRAAERLKIEESLTSLVARTSGITLIAFGVVSALGTLGIDVTAIVAGLGLTGFALGFALKDTISNLVSGALIMLYRPFEKGNRIKISGYEGTVVSIDLRYTELDSDGNRVLIPNSRLFKDPITVLN